MNHLERKEVGKKQLKEANVVDINAGSTNFIVLLPKTHQLEGRKHGKTKGMEEVSESKEKEKGSIRKEKSVPGNGKTAAGRH